MISHRLVGRERELLELMTALERTRGGSGGARVVAGPPGIGKTRLATELTTTAHANGVGVHWGRCWHGDVAPAFWPWVQVLRSMEADGSDVRVPLVDVLALIGPRSPPSSPGDATAQADGFVVLDQLASAVAATARARTTVVVIDDVQWADASSLQAFAHIATTATACPLLLIALLRSTDEASRTDIAELARLAPRVEVAALSEQEVEELLAVALGEQPTELLLDRVLVTPTSFPPVFVASCSASSPPRRLLRCDEESGLEVPRGAARHQIIARTRQHVTPLAVRARAMDAR